MTYTVPMSAPDLTEAERAAVAAVLNTPNLSMGAEIGQFEQTFCNLTGLQHAIGVNSGTAALHLCVRAAGIQRGDLVITTPFSFVASTNVILFEGGIPVYVDVDPLTGNICPQQVRAALADLAHGGAAAQKWLPPRVKAATTRPKALLTVDVFGQPADADPLLQAATEYGIPVIEDSCEALGATYKGRQAGTLGKYGMFAFYPNKQITTGEGGVIVTDDDQAAHLMRALRNQGRAPGDTWLQHTHLGYNYRLDEMSAALGRVQMSRLDEMLTKRERVAQWYNQRLKDLPGVEIPHIAPTTTRMSWFVYVIRFDPKLNRDQIAAALEARGIPARPYFIPIHWQPYIIERFGYHREQFQAANNLGTRGLALPFSSVMTEEQVETVCQTLRAVL